MPFSAVCRCHSLRLMCENGAVGSQCAIERAVPAVTLSLGLLGAVLRFAQTMHLEDDGVVGSNQHT